MTIKEWLFNILNSGTQDTVTSFRDLDNPSIEYLGSQAEDLLKNGALLEAFKRIEKEFFTMWQNSKPLDREGREAVWRGYQAVNELKLKLNGMVQQMLMEQQIRKEHKDGT